MPYTRPDPLFPATPILDTFSGTLSGWTTGIVSGNPSHLISGGKLVENGGSNDSNYWSTQFAADQEAYFTTDNTNWGTSGISLCIRIQNPGTATPSYYVLDLFALSTNVYIQKVIAGAAPVQLGPGLVFTIPLTGNQTVGIRAIGNTISSWQWTAATGWVLRGTVVDNSIVGAGYIGLTSGDFISSDDFGGGAVNPAGFYQADGLTYLEENRGR